MRAVWIVGVVVVGCGGAAKDAADTLEEWEQRDAVDAVEVPGLDVRETAESETGDAAEADAAAPGCEVVQQGSLLKPDEEPTKFALSVFHFNLQYVAGGLMGFMDDVPETFMDESEVEDAIVTESFDPLLDILLAHPTWGFDIELQGYMLDVLRERFPLVLEKMRTLVAAGQLQVDSFHYSDQLWVAHPVVSMEHSWELNEQAFEAACLPPGKAMFSQEGQFGQGMAERVAGLGTVAAFPRNLFHYFAGEVKVPLVYQWKGASVVIAGDAATGTAGGKEVQATWIFVNDGELACTGNANPYFGKLFKYDKEGTAKWVAEVEALESDGYRIVPIREYVDKVLSYGYHAEELPLTLDGTWQPGETQNVWRWMGLVGAFPATEDDNGVLTAVTRSRFALQTAEVLVSECLKDEALRGETSCKLGAGWREQCLAEVSDGTGWNPFAGEVAYAFTHSALAAQIAAEAIAAVMGQYSLNKVLYVDTGTGEVSEQSPGGLVYQYAAPDGFVPLWGDCAVAGLDPLGVEVKADGWVTSGGLQLCDGPGLQVVELSAVPDVGVQPNVSILFHSDASEFSYVPALTEEALAVTPFVPAQFAVPAGQPLAIALANGLLGIGTSRWLIALGSTVHLAALMMPGEAAVWFESHSQPLDKPFSWSFVYLEDEGEEVAVETANRINVYPVVRVDNL